MGDSDLLYIADRRKKEFNYPLHTHTDFELNYIENASGVRRIVGDSSEVIDDYDLVLVTGPDLEHGWMQDSCKSDSIHEITIQFRFELSEYSIFGKKPFAPILKMLQDARKGLVFPMSAIMQVHNSLTSLSAQQDRFTLFLEFLKILNTLANADRYRTLATDCYANVAVKKESWRVQKVLDFMDNHYMDDIKLKALAEIACMSEASFSRFFKQKTGRNISEYIIDMRLGHATRLLVDTDKSVADISFQCGFNNLSNFNRIFKRKKQCSPTEFRQYYYKTRKII